MQAIKQYLYCIYCLYCEVALVRRPDLELECYTLILAVYDIWGGGRFLGFTGHSFNIACKLRSWSTDRAIDIHDHLRCMYTALADLTTCCVVLHG